MDKKKVYLTLANGKVFQGYRFGADGESTGELVFSTNMVGYVETLTDPSNYGQIMVQTFPLIGNYGVARSDAESERAWVSAYVVREICEEPSNFRSEVSLDTYMKEQGVIGVYGIDTRELTRILREEGTMNAAITNKKLTEEKMKKLAAYSVDKAVETVSPAARKEYGEVGAKHTVALWNFGAKNSTINNLVAQGCRVISMPAGSSAEEILATGADCVVLSDGPGDPKENKGIVEEVKKLLGKKPILGLGLGHQLVALATGADTVKNKYGHRGGNQPVRCEENGKVYISTQNHGYEVGAKTLTAGKVSFTSVNDGSCEGVEYADLHAFTVQFAPECCAIGDQQNPVYEKLFAMAEKEKENA